MLLATKLLGCVLIAVPHIDSRVRHFRTKYGAIELCYLEVSLIEMIIEKCCNVRNSSTKLTVR
jgi:hypothetical protein